MIKVRKLGKLYKIYPRPFDRLKEWVSGRKCHSEFWALRDVSFDLPEGRCLGIVGPNGAGKSTLLKILTGTTHPTEGEFNIKGRVAALLELGTGFHHEFTGRQNAIMNAKMLGLSDEEIEEKLEAIIRFSELGDFIDRPVRTYSSGMFIRLGFAVASAVDPDVLIIDEALAVGDIAFQQKCIRRIRDFLDSGRTMLFVSHDPGAVKLLCREAILLYDGRVVADGNPDDVIDHYNSLLARRSVDAAVVIRSGEGNGKATAKRTGTFQALLTGIGVYDTNDNPLEAVVAGQRVRFRVEVLFLDNIEDPTVGVLIRDRLGVDMFGTNTRILNKDIGSRNFGDRVTVSFEMDLNLGHGTYTLTSGVHAADTHVDACYDWAEKMLAFRVIPAGDFYFHGSVKLFAKVQVNRHERDENVDLASALEGAIGEVPSAVDFGPDAGTLLGGWHGPELIEREYARWAGRVASFLLGRKGNAVKLKIITDYPGINEKPLRINIQLNGVDLDEIELKDTEWNEFILNLPETVRGRVLLGRLKASASWKPSEAGGSSDGRELSVKVAAIECVEIPVDS